MGEFLFGFGVLILFSGMFLGGGMLVFHIFYVLIG